MNKIQVSDSPKPVGHYSQAIVSNGFLFTSGILPIKIKSSEKLPIESSIEQQLAVVFDNLTQILQEIGLDANHVVKTTVYISSGEYWGIVNELYAAFFGEHRPARSIIPVNELHFGYKIELEAIAEVPK
ncbi:2-iminobutanoate/2-iminopropanoate deaminase [Emticicia aquatica]|jgi:2-iminobutanoate/2-iminopropanoate deaminase|uniref:2-iminobutanoate/2-iminopropanoate deaminase n=1 Tax=Emticicia aquatica TaxID=1681835 RepID=A0ABM9AMB1_9BACT|nr:Rid family detoxifying hydrolase [Emticicia aquatica]CAH0994751.1 2-iminobutanoate/2-iminopropanoate deaminase [Emticicia aquatica]